MLKNIFVFVLVFFALAVTIAGGALSSSVDGLDVLSASTGFMKESEQYIEDEEYVVTAPAFSTLEKDEFTPRLKAPDSQNEYYYSDLNVLYDSGWGMPNCTCYAWGRAYEMTGEKPQLSLGNANEWYDYNKQNKIYAYGTKPKAGAIACFSYTDRDCGHVAVVEVVTDDKIYFSNSAWSGDMFYVSDSPLSDPSDSKANWNFQGYIYVDEKLS
ncbi:MAG: CHAP domain-containing protein [Eubacteriales bacterium]|nr:CHAP domain-containing protein [Eubacteriales bacterium]